MTDTWKELDVIEGALGTEETLVRIGAKGSLQAILGRSPVWGWHLSVSYKNQHPTNQDIADAIYEFWPKEIPMLPPEQSLMIRNIVHIYEKTETQ